MRPQSVTIEWFLAAGCAAGFPMLEIQRGESVAAGETAWGAFVARATAEQLFRAMSALIVRDAESRFAWIRNCACGGGVTA